MRFICIYLRNSSCGSVEIHGETYYTRIITHNIIVYKVIDYEYETCLIISELFVYSDLMISQKVTIILLVK